MPVLDVTPINGKVHYRPVRWLVGFQVVHLDPGEATEITIVVPTPAFTLHVGVSVLDIADSAELTTGL